MSKISKKDQAAKNDVKPISKEQQIAEFKKRVKLFVNSRRGKL